MLILSETAKHSNYTQYFIRSPVKENLSIFDCECTSLSATLAFVLQVPFVPACFSFYVPYLSLFFLCPFRASIFYVPYVPSFSTRLTCPHLFPCLDFLCAFHTFTFLRVSNFWRTLCAFTFLKNMEQPITNGNKLE